MARRLGREAAAWVASTRDDALATAAGAGRLDELRAAAGRAGLAEAARAVDAGGLTAVERAAAGGHLEAVRWLVERAGASPRGRSWDADSGEARRWFALECDAARRRRCGWTETPVPRFCGAAVDDVPPGADEALFGGPPHAGFRSNRPRAGCSPALLAAAGGHLAVLRFLVAAAGGRDVLDECTGDGRRAVHHAAAYGHAGVVRALVREMGCPRDDPSYASDTPLTAALGAGRAAVARLLVAELGADVNAPAPLVACEEWGRNAWPPLFFCATAGCVSYLLECGADPDARVPGVDVHNRDRPGTADEAFADAGTSPRLREALLLWRAGRHPSQLAAAAAGRAASPYLPAVLLRLCTSYACAGS